MASIASLRAFDCRSYWFQYGVSVNARTCALAVPTNLRRVIIAAGETLTRIFAHKITLANLDPGLTQNIVGRCDVETKLWHCVVQEKDPSGEVEGPRCLFEFDLSILTARELFRCNPLDKIDRLGNSPSQVGEARILGTEVRRFNADQLSHCSARKVKSDTNLAGQVEHIGTNAHLEKHGFLNLVEPRNALQLYQGRRKVRPDTGRRREPKSGASKTTCVSSIPNVEIAVAGLPAACIWAYHVR